MISLMLALAVLGNDIVPHQLRKEIVWQHQQEMPNITLKSYVSLSIHKVRLIQNELDDIQYKFKQYYGIKCNPGHLEIRVLRLSWLNSSEYFVWTDPKYIVLGRYFGMRNILYITPEAFAELYILDHELAHYMYDECNMRMGNEDQEHLRLDEFIRWRNQNE